MAVLSIEKYGSETLRKPCAVVKQFDKKLKKITDNMLETMYAADGVGLAAPQIGINQRIIVIDVDYSSNRYADEKDKDPNSEVEYNPYIMINPVIVFKEGEIDSFEGCLSFPEVFTEVKRAKRIVFKFQDLAGKEVRMEAEDDLFCRCIQHEIDHLDGKLFVDIAVDKSAAQKELNEHGFKGVKSPPNPLLIS